MAAGPQVSFRQGTAAEVAALCAQLPEFVPPLRTAADIAARCAGVPSHCLVAVIDGQAVAFKLGYERTGDGSFYSWLGGVLPAYRRQGLARQLADRQERWAKAQGYRSLRFKTRNRHRAMLHLALSQGFMICGYEPRPLLADSRIWLEKPLTALPAAPTLPPGAGP